MERLTKYEPREGGIPLVIVDDEQSALQKLAMYEDLIEQGLLVRLPCKIKTEVFRLVAGCCARLEGCTVYCDGYEYECPEYKMERYVIEQGHFSYNDIVDFGKLVFLTREDAEAALAKEG